MYIVIRHSEAGSLILTRHDNFNAILDEMKLDMEYAYLKEYGGDIKLKDSDQFDDIGLTFRTKKPYDDRPLVTGYLNDIFNDGKVTEYTWDLFQIQPLSKKLVDLAAKAEAEGYHHLAYQLDGVLGVFDAVQDAAEEDGSFTPPVADEDTGRFADEDYNDVLKKILDADAKTTKKKEM